MQTGLVPPARPRTPCPHLPWLSSGLAPSFTEHGTTLSYRRDHWVILLLGAFHDSPECTSPLCLQRLPPPAPAVGLHCGLSLPRVGTGAADEPAHAVRTGRGASGRPFVRSMVNGNTAQRLVYAVGGSVWGSCLPLASAPSPLLLLLLIAVLGPGPTCREGAATSRNTVKVSTRRRWGR